MELDDSKQEQPQPSSPTKTEKTHKCTFDGCSASFCRPYRLKSHLRVHSGERPYTCNSLGCSKSYTNLPHLKRHTLICHVEDDSIKQKSSCPECELVLANKYSLQKHIIRQHTEGNFPFKCSQCPKRFKKEPDYSSHITDVHDSVPNICESCQIGFLRMHDYKRHLKNHKIFTCDCEKQFDRYRTFCEHKRTDCLLKPTEFLCEICKKSFTKKNNLKQHTDKVHAEGNQKTIYECPFEECTRSYQYKKNLNYHISFYHKKSSVRNIIELQEHELSQLEEQEFSQLEEQEFS